jgi:hypothetical protein
MSTLLAVLAIVGLLALALLRSLALEEARGRIARRVRRSLEQTIESLPPELAAEWGEEWRAELAALESMPLSAIGFARNVRRGAAELAGAPALAGAGGAAGAPVAGTSTDPRWPARVRQLLARLGAGPGPLRLMKRSRRFRVVAIFAGGAGLVADLIALSAPAAITAVAIALFTAAAAFLISVEPRR